MGDSDARASGKPGVYDLITGPAFLNAPTAPGQAYSDSATVLLIASCPDEAAARRHPDLPANNPNKDKRT